MKFIKFVIRLVFCHLFYHVKYVGLENLDNNQKYLICPNHSHIFDPVWLYPKIENLFIMAKSEIFKNPVIARLLKHYGIFPVRREKRDAKSVFHAMEILQGDSNRKLLIFPEGAVIKPDKERGNVKNGAVFIASQTETPILPVHITKNPHLFSNITVTFGEAMNLSKEIAQNKEQVREKSKELLNKIYELQLKKSDKNK